MDALIRYRTPLSDSERWQRFDHRSGDIVISAPQKSGTTWTQMLCALLIFDGTNFPETLDGMSPWLDMLTRTEDEVFALFARQEHRRFIKTHTPLDGLPIRDDVTYLVVGRDPRDVLISFEHHLANVDGEKLGAVLSATTNGRGQLPSPPVLDDPSARFRAFIDGPTEGGIAPTLAGILHHLHTGWRQRTQPNVALFHFSDYRRNLADEMARLARVLGLRFDRPRLATLAQEAGIDRMRERAEELAPDTTRSHWRDVRRFFRSGGTGEWRARTSPADRGAYDRRVAELAQPDFATWVHEGSRIDRH